MAGGGGLFRQKYKGGYSTPGAAKFNAKLDEATANADASIPEGVYARKVTKTPEQLLDEWYSKVHKSGIISPDLLKDISDRVTIEDFNAWAKSRDLEASPEIALNRLKSDLGTINSSIKYEFDAETVAPDHYTDNYIYSDHVYYPNRYGDSPELTSNKTTGTNENFVKNSELTESNKYTPTGQKPTGWGDKTSSYTFNPLYSYKFIDPNLSRHKQSKDTHIGQVPESPNAVNTLEPSTIFLNRLLGYERPKRSGGKLTGLGYAGLTGLALLAPYLKQDSTNEQLQTQAPYRMEPEQETARVELPVVPVSEEQPVTELTPEQQFVLQSLSPFDYAKAANLFDLYDRYGSLASSSNSANNEELIDEVMNETILPQEPPAAGTNIEDANRIIPEATEIPEDVNDAMRKAKPGSFWKTTRGMVAPKVQAVKDAAQSAYERALKRSKSTPVTAEEPAGPVVLNAPKQHKTANRTVSQNTVKQAADVSKTVNNSQKPEAALAQSLVRAQQESGLTTDAIWNRLRQKGLVSPEQAIRSGLFTPDEVRYITENDLWRYK